MPQYYEITFTTSNPKAVDEILMKHNGLVENRSDGSYVLRGGKYTARIFGGDPRYVSYLLHHQGYAGDVSEPVLIKPSTGIQRGRS